MADTHVPFSARSTKPPPPVGYHLYFFSLFFFLNFVVDFVNEVILLNLVDHDVRLLGYLLFVFKIWVASTVLVFQFVRPRWVWQASLGPLYLFWLAPPKIRLVVIVNLATVAFLVLGVNHPRFDAIWSWYMTLASWGSVIVIYLLFMMYRYATFTLPENAEVHPVIIILSPFIGPFKMFHNARTRLNQWFREC